MVWLVWLALSALGAVYAFLGTRDSEKRWLEFVFVFAVMELVVSAIVFKI